jgi:Uma2 family endonuclease
MQADLVQPHRWTRAQYERMVEDGYFKDGERVELLDGEILAMTPQNSTHATSAQKAARALETAFGTSAHARQHYPLAITADSMPEPDVAVVAGTVDDYAQAHPTTAMLVVEIADTSLKLDRFKKGALYAWAGIADYWIVNLNDRTVEVYRDPVETAQGWGYRIVQRHGEDGTVAPLTRPEAIIAVHDLLPRP